LDSLAGFLGDSELSLYDSSDFPSFFFFSNFFLLSSEILSFNVNFFFSGYSFLI